jgi:hypothetical protein
VLTSVGRKRLGYDHEAGCAMLALLLCRCWWGQCVYGKKMGQEKLKGLWGDFGLPPKTMPLG